MGRARLLPLLLCLAAAVAAPAAQGADDPYAALLAPSGTCGAAADQLDLDASTAQAVMQCLTNYARGQAGLAPLALTAALNGAGQAKLAADLSCAEFSHTPCGQPFSSVFAAYLSGATSYQIGENIAWGTGSFGTPRQTMNGWLHSTAHRENILVPAYTELGVGYAPNQTFQGYNGATLWSQEFGVRAPALAAPTPTVTTAKPTVNPPARKKPRRHLRRRLGLRSS
jgi:uncharacterized protein YkwD